MNFRTTIIVAILVIIAAAAGFLAGKAMESGDDSSGKPSGEEGTNYTKILTVNSTGNNSWTAQKFYLAKDTSMYMQFEFYSEYETDHDLFESMYLVNLEKDAQYEDVYSDTRVYAGDGIDKVYGHGNLVGVNESYNRTGSPTSGTYHLTHIWLGFTLENGTWYFVFETNGPHKMSFLMVFQDNIEVLEKRTGNHACFAYDSRNFTGDLKGGFAGGNFNSGGSLEQYAAPYMLATFWAEDSSANTGATRISFTSPNGTTGARTYAGAGAGIRNDEGDFMDPLIGEAGKWEFEIQFEAKTDEVFLCGAGVDIGY